MKKSASINRYRFIFFEVGLIIALSLSLMAFRIEGTDKQILNDEPIYSTPVVQINAHTEYQPQKKKKKKIIRKKRVEQEDLTKIKLVPDHIKLVTKKQKRIVKKIPLQAASFVSHKVVKAEKVVKFPDEMPEFPGGSAALMKYLRKELVYPTDAERNEAEGAVVVSFVVDEEGNITQIKVEKDDAGYGCATEAVRVIQKMPKWKPGILNGKKVKTRFLQKIRFELSF